MDTKPDGIVSETRQGSKITQLVLVKSFPTHSHVSLIHEIVAVVMDDSTPDDVQCALAPSIVKRLKCFIYRGHHRFTPSIDLY